MNHLFAPLLFLVAGLVLGSFGNVLVARVPEGQPITGRSRCMRCLKTLGFSELVPVFSWLLQRGKCRGCDAPVSWQYPLVETLTALLFLLALKLVEPNVSAAFFLGTALWMLLLIAVADAKSSLIPDAFSGLFILASLLAAVMLHGRVDLLSPLVGIVFFGFQWLISRGRWVGSGDIPVAAGIGLLLGDWKLAVIALTTAYIVGCVAVIPGLLSGRLKRNDHLPFVPFLMAGTLITLLWGDGFLRALGL